MSAAPKTEIIYGGYIDSRKFLPDKLFGYKILDN